MFSLALVFGTLLAAASTPTLAPTPAYTKDDGPIILFLVDNSASLPSLDPDEKRVIALEKMFGFLDGHPYRSIMFGGRHEIFVDDPTKYNADESGIPAPLNTNVSLATLAPPLAINTPPAGSTEFAHPRPIPPEFPHGHAAPLPSPAHSAG